MKLQRLTDHCYAVTHDRNRICDANSGFVSTGGGLLIDTQADLNHAQQLARLIQSIDDSAPGAVLNTHEDGDHVWGNQQFAKRRLIAHRSVPERMREVADPAKILKLQRTYKNWATRPVMMFAKRALYHLASQLNEHFDFEGIKLTEPTELFDDRTQLSLGQLQVELLHLGPCHQQGDVVAFVSQEGVLFAGDLVFRNCTPIGWCGTYENWTRALDRMGDMEPRIIVPGHGEPCGREGLLDMKELLELVYERSKSYFDRGASAITAAAEIDLGRFATWNAPARVYFCIERAYREFRGDPPNHPWNIEQSFGNMYRAAVRRGDPIEF